MQYVIGIDGGGTKTRGVLMTTTGEFVAECTAGPSNYQIIGAAAAQETLQKIYDDLCLHCEAHQVVSSYFGLSGADLPVDFEVLNRIATAICKGTPHIVENDTWCVLRSALHQSWGAVSLYGTGSNAGAVSKNGEKHILRALGYVAGGSGGGDDMAMTALHYAFRSEEGTYKATVLEQKIPQLLGLETMSEVVDLVYPEFIISETLFKNLPPLLFETAAEGDAVAIEILQNFGRTQGEMVKGMLVRADLLGETVPIVLGGSVYKGSSPHFLDAMMATIHEIAPGAFPTRPELPPVAGAVLLALEAIQIELNSVFYDALSVLKN